MEARLYISKQYGFIDQAVQYTKSNEQEVADWCAGRPYRPGPWVTHRSMDDHLRIPLRIKGEIGGHVKAYVGDFIIKPAKGPFFALPPSTFRAMYTLLDQII